MSNSTHEMSQELSRELKSNTEATEVAQNGDDATSYIHRKLAQLQLEIAQDEANKVEDMDIDSGTAQIRKFDEIRKEQKEAALAQMILIRTQQRQLQQLMGIVPRCKKTLNF